MKKTKAKKKKDIPAVNINFYGDYWKGALKTKGNPANFDTKLTEKDYQIDTTISLLNSKTIKEVENKKNMAKKKVAKKDKVELKKKKVKVEKKEELKKEEAPAEAVEEKVEEKVETAKEEEKKEEPAKEEEAEEAPEGDKPAEEKADKTVDLLKSVVEKLDAMLAKNEENADAAAPADEEASEEAAPEAEEKEAPAEEEEVVEDASPEGAEKLEKMTGSLEKVAKSLKKFGKSIEGLETRIKAIEDQPMPSEVASTVVVSKGADVSEEDTARVKEINKELKELNDLKTQNLERYQSENKWQKAVSLLEEKDTLKVRV